MSETHSHEGKPRTTMGVGMGNDAWVRHHQGDGTLTVYRVEPTEPKAEYGPDDYTVTVEEGPDVLDHAEVRLCAHDAYIDAYGAL